MKIRIYLNISMKLFCPCRHASPVTVSEYPEDGNSIHELYISCSCINDQHICLKAGEVEEDYKKVIHHSLVTQKVHELLLEKTRLLDEYGVLTWRKSVRKKHKKINEALEALGAYQGKVYWEQLY